MPFCCLEQWFALNPSLHPFFPLSPTTVFLVYLDVAGPSVNHCHATQRQIPVDSNINLRTTSFKHDWGLLSFFVLSMWSNNNSVWNVITVCEVYPLYNMGYWYHVRAGACARTCVCVCVCVCVCGWVGGQTQFNILFMRSISSVIWNIDTLFVANPHVVPQIGTVSESLKPSSLCEVTLV
jgi:hypothetical protein